ncbi:MAG: hypothetical protein HYW47_01135 [Deltaproteobacteria bacterium]|nr:hypothetical protein [Deltaproteobacteria bacterium]
MSGFFRSFFFSTFILALGLQGSIFSLNTKEKLSEIGTRHNTLIVKVKLIKAESKWEGSQVITYWKAQSLEDSINKAPSSLIGSNKEFEFTSQGGIPNEAPTDPKLSGCGKEPHNLCGQVAYGSGTEELFKMLTINQEAYIVLEHKSGKRTPFHLVGSVRIAPISRDSTTGEEVIKSDLELNGQIQQFSSSAPLSIQTHDDSARYKLGDFKEASKKAFGK